MIITLLSSFVGQNNYIGIHLNAYPILCWNEKPRGGEVHSWVAKIYPKVETYLSGCCYPKVHLTCYLCFLWLYPGKYTWHFFTVWGDHHHHQYFIYLFLMRNIINRKLKKGEKYPLKWHTLSSTLFFKPINRICSSPHKRNFKWPLCREFHPFAVLSSSNLVASPIIHSFCKSLLLLPIKHKFICSIQFSYIQ